MNEATFQERGPWGLWATVALGLAAFIVFYVVQLWALTTFGIDGLTATPDRGLPAIDGMVLSIAILLGAASCSALIFLFVWLRRGPSLRDYLFLHRVSIRVLFFWLGVQILLTAGWDVVTWAIGREVIPPFMRDAWVNVDARPLLFVAVVGAAPFFEEIFFRGFLLEGFRRSRLGAVGAVMLTALLWAVVHLQYELYEMISIFLFGLVLGYARLRSGSLFIPMAMHAMANGIVLVELALIVR